MKIEFFDGLHYKHICDHNKHDEKREQYKEPR